MVSIIIPNFNRAEYLKQALKSIKNQTYQDWEALVIDDGSTDGSKETVSTLADGNPQIKWYARSRNPKGAATCRNIGLENARGDYIVFLDSDDLLAPHCLTQRIKVMQANPQLDFAVFKMQFFFKNPKDDTRVWNLENDKTPLERFLKLDAVWQTTGPIWKKDPLKKTGGFNENLHCWQDIDIHLKALFHKLTYQICYDLPVDCYYRKNAQGTISQSNLSSLPKLKSKTVLYEWAKKKVVHIHHSTEIMLCHILISAINAHHFNHFKTLFSTEQEELPLHKRKAIQRMFVIKVWRLDKIKAFKNRFNALKEKCTTTSTIGQFHDQ